MTLLLTVIHPDASYMLGNGISMGCREGTTECMYYHMGAFWLISDQRNTMNMKTGEVRDPFIKRRGELMKVPHSTCFVLIFGQTRVL